MEIDRKTLKALSADTRLDILKSLGKRRKTPSELSKELNLAASTVVEHLNKLEGAGLIRKEETGHKWIYYALTKKGSSLVKPKVPTQFIIVFSLIIFVVAVGFSYYYLFNYATLTPGRSDMLSIPSTEGTSRPFEQTEIPEETSKTIEPSIAVTGGSANMTNVTNVTNTTNTTMP